ncbi:MAG: DUF3616 domain-containing protein [Acidobacteria bacterium]|nr:DUF3616 domain-containing protein [Acidobacteriota bacterium]
MINECPQCNFPIPREGSRFCNQCGTDLRAILSAQLEAPTPAGVPAKAAELQKNIQTPNSANLPGIPGGRPPQSSPDVLANPNMTVPKEDTNVPKTEATLHILMRDGSVVERDLAAAETKIGKAPQNDILLPDASVSSSHAMISLADGHFTISDLGSRNGTFVNDARIHDSRKLAHGDLIRMGHCTITFRLKEAETTQSIPRTVLLDNSPPPPPTPPPAPKTVPVTEDSLAQALVSAGLVAQPALDRLRGSAAQQPGRRLARALVEEKLVSEIGLRDLMGRTFNLPPIEMKTMEVDAVTAGKLRVDFLRSRCVCPIIGQQPDRLMLAVADPTDKATIDHVERLTGKKASLRLAMFSEIAAHIENHFTPRLIGVLPNGEKIEALLNQPEIEIGKAPHNKLIVNDPTVSSTHAIVLVRDGGYSIVDLGSSNGTFINGNRQGGEAYTLQHGDKIQLGNVMLTFRNPAETTENKTARLSLEALEEVRRRASLRSDPAYSFPRTDPNMSALPPSKVTTAAEDEEAEKAERKKKKKEKDKGGFFSANALSRIIAQVMGAVVTIAGTILVAKYALTPASNSGGTGGSSNSASAKVARSDSWYSLPGSRIEASGVAHVPGSDQVLIVDDGQPGVVLALKLDANGDPIGVPKAVPLGMAVKNPEAITSDGTHFYVIGSLSDASWGADNAIIRFAFDPQTQTLRGQPEIISDFRGFLLGKIPELKGQGEVPSTQGGLNIEGLAWDKLHDRLIVGLRSLNAALAVLVPLRLNNPKGEFSAANLVLETPRIIQLPLGGQGVRDITYDTHLKSFLIISGAPEGVEKGEFKLWEWDGESLSTKVREEMTLNSKFKPEGITAAVVNGRPFLFLVGDASSYLKLDYSDVK